MDRTEIEQKFNEVCQSDGGGNSICRKAHTEAGKNYCINYIDNQLKTHKDMTFEKAVFHLEIFLNELGI